jgi:CDP-glucose 4,6-dehydratase
VGEARPTHAVVERLCGALGVAPEWRHAPRPEIRERAMLALDSALARKSLGWRPRLAIDAALDWTAEWYAGFGAGQSAAALTDAQIARYEALP